jgi:predicted transcriptional regulator
MVTEYHTSKLGIIFMQHIYEFLTIFEINNDYFPKHR